MAANGLAYTSEPSGGEQSGHTTYPFWPEVLDPGNISMTNIVDNKEVITYHEENKWQKNLENTLDSSLVLLNLGSKC